MLIILEKTVTLSISLTMILVVAVLAGQLSSIVSPNGNTVNIVYAKKYSSNYEQAASTVIASVKDL